jgi:UDP-glucuronate decarboxylase
MTTKNVIKKTPLSPTVLIAGGAGFIGSHLAEALLLKEARVIVLDNFKTGKDFWVGHLLSNPKFALYDVDINSALPPEIESVDYIFHLAGVEEYLYSDKEVNLDALLTNAVGTKALLDLAHRSSAKFLLASSIYVYQGMMSQINLGEYFGRTSVEEKKYSLTEAKRYAEALAWEYYKKHDTDVRIVRLPEIYGPKMDLEASGNLGRLITELTDGKDLTVYGEGVEKEHYLFINDAVSGIIKALFNDKTKGKIFSLVTPEPYSTLEVSFLLRSLANHPIKVNFKPKPKGIEPRSVYPDTSNLKDLKWDVRTSFRDGVIKTLNWFGYDTTDRSFKPAKLIDDKEKENTISESGIVTSEKSIVPKEEIKEAISSMVDIVGLSDHKDVEKPSYKIFKREEKELQQEKAPPTGERKLIKSLLMAVPAALLILGLLFLGIPLLHTYVSVNRASNDLRQVPVLLSQFDPERSQQKAETAFYHFHRAQTSFGRVGWFYGLIGQADQHSSISKLISSATYTSRSAYYFSKAFTPFSSLWDAIKPNSELVFDEEGFERAKSDFAIARNNLQLAEAEFKHVDLNNFSSSFSASIEEYSGQLSSASSGMEVFSSALLGMSDLIGMESPKKYLILFQNSNEIRPTGGFIGSYAVLEIDKGKITSLTIDDIYNPDGQLELRDIQTTPPEPISLLLEEETLFIRNANWDPDFRQASRQIEELFYRATDTRVDGVVAVDLTFALNILEVTGPLYLTAYNEEISSANLYERTQFHSAFNYEDGSDQKRSFLTVLGSKLLEKVFALPAQDMPGFWKQVSNSLTQRHLLVYLPNNPLGAVLEDNKWDGGLVKTDGDYLYVVNANLGGTKANYYIENGMEYEILSETRDGLLRGRLTLTYTHTANGSSWPGGPYTNYVRILTQNGSKLTGAVVSIGEESEDRFEEVVVSKVGNYNSFETPFVLEPGEVAELVFTYDLPASLSVTKDTRGYDLYWQKQPGTHGDNFSFKFNPPFGMISDITELSGLMDQDKDIYVMLKPQ